MTGTELAIREPRQIVRLDTDQLRYIANTEFVPAALRGNLPAIMAAVATGRELGIGDMAALRSIHVIDGKPTLSAEAMVALVRRAGHSIVGGVEEGRARVTGTRVDNGDTMTCEWTTDMAERAGLTNKGNWRKYEESMLWARAVSQLCRMLFADVFTGASTYTAEELGDDSLDEGGDAKALPASATPLSPSDASAGEPQAEPLPPLDGEPVSAPVRGEAPSPADVVPGEEDLPEPLRSSPTDPISEKQRGLIFGLADSKGMPDDEMKRLVCEAAGISSRSELNRGNFEAALRAVEEWEPPDPEDEPQRALIDMVPQDVQAATRRRLETGE